MSAIDLAKMGTAKVAFPAEVEDPRKAIFSPVDYRVIRHENVQLLEFKGQKLIVELFNVLARTHTFSPGRDVQDVH